jgi:antitoxin VapB
MSLYIRSEEADRLAREVAQRTGETLTEAVTTALRQRLETLPDTGSDGDFDALWRYTQGLQETLAALPLRDHRPHDQMLYDENGLPK